MQEATLASQLLVAVRTRDVVTIRRLCSSPSENLRGALKRRDGQGHTLMHWAAKSGDVEMMETLAGMVSWRAVADPQHRRAYDKTRFGGRRPNP